MSQPCLKCGKARSHFDHSRGVCEYEATPRQPKPRKDLNHRSEKMATFYREERIPLIEQVIARDGNRCMILSPWHERLADWNPITVHEIATRGREGGIRAAGVNEADNCVTACLRCNQACSENPEWAEAHGWLKPASPIDNVGR